MIEWYRKQSRLTRKVVALPLPCAVVVEGCDCGIPRRGVVNPGGFPIMRSSRSRLEFLRSLFAFTPVPLPAGPGPPPIKVPLLLLLVPAPLTQPPPTPTPPMALSWSESSATADPSPVVAVVVARDGRRDLALPFWTFWKGRVSGSGGGVSSSGWRVPSASSCWGCFSCRDCWLLLPETILLSREKDGIARGWISFSNIERVELLRERDIS
ncbi:hypothetical protein GE09DRAFT_77526 [Coniochaeta sp. 2T2.1]|nr:hypothetical protein GE09DRAFT_77526 [Coniochaeta sp. 2T2.1]